MKSLTLERHDFHEESERMQTQQGTTAGRASLRAAWGEGASAEIDDAGAGSKQAAFMRLGRAANRLGHRAVEVACLSALASAGELSSQEQAIELTHVESCAECRIVPNRLLRVETRNSPLPDPMMTGAVARDMAGRYWITNSTVPLPQVYTASGEFVDRVGSEGQGPGEFMASRTLIPVQDSMIVFDPHTRRLTVVGPDLRPCRSVSVPGSVRGGVALRWPRIAVNALFPTPEAVGHPFHILNHATGEVEASFGGSATYRGNDYWQLFGYLAYHDSSGAIWTARRHEFKLQRWTESGRLLATLAAPESMFPSGGRGRIGNHSTPPDPVITDMVVSGDTAFVIYYLPRHDWAEAWSDVPNRPHIASGEMPALDALRMGYVALIDLREGAILGVDEFDLYTVGIGGQDGTFAVGLEVGSLFPALGLYRFRIRTR